jgi:hypothetical protein
MSAAVVRILAVGTTTTSTQKALETLERAGWNSHTIETRREAETVLRTIRFGVILAAENLPDGTGYELTELVARQSGTLFVAVTLSESCLWLPVVERGCRSLGKRAMNSEFLEAEVATIMRAFDVKAQEEDYEKLRRKGSSGAVLRADNPMTNPDGKLPRADLAHIPIQHERSIEARPLQKKSLPAFRKTATAPPSGALAVPTAINSGNSGSQMHGKWWRGQ